MRSIQHKILAALLVCTLLTLSGCFKGPTGGGNNGGNNGNGKGNWDALVWDQNQWQ